MPDIWICTGTPCDLMSLNAQISRGAMKTADARLWLTRSEVTDKEKYAAEENKD